MNFAHPWWGIHRTVRLVAWLAFCAALGLSVGAAIAAHRLRRAS